MLQTRPESNGLAVIEVIAGELMSDNIEVEVPESDDVKVTLSVSEDLSSEVLTVEVLRSFSSDLVCLSLRGLS